MILKRTFNAPDKSFFLFGPRGTGKSTWLRNHYSYDLYIDLLESGTFLNLTRNPSYLNQLVAPLKPGSKVVIDEIQKVAPLLDQIHLLYEEKKVHFALSGSSVRKLKRGASNLLAGRVLQNFLYPMTFAEYTGHYSPQEAIEWGTLPLVISEEKYRRETLNTYIETYLRQEIVEEGLIRKIEPFVRFLEVAGIMNAQVLNIENIARESGVSRSTVQTYFELLEDTLIGFKLLAFQANLKVKEVKRPKFYFFDPGVARACAGLINDPLDRTYKGYLLETLVLNEVRAFNCYHKKHRRLFYYHIANSYEIDLIIELKRSVLNSPAELICCEIKLAEKWNNRWCRPINDFAAHTKHKVTRKIGIYLGKDQLKIDDFEVYPLSIFLEMLHSNSIF